MDELEKELNKRGTAEIIEGKVHQITQAIDEDEKQAKVIVFGELRKFGVKPIEECCPCNFLKHYSSIQECRERQKKDAIGRWFTSIICPEQLID
jgi:hypothetical protein